jgi:hypothetical protein
VGCLGVGEVARGEQLIANQGQEWMGIHTTRKRSRISKYVSKKKGWFIQRGQNEAKMEGKGWVDRKSITVVCIHVYIHICLLYVICK